MIMSNFSRSYTKHLADMLWNKYADILKRSKFILEKEHNTILKMSSDQSIFSNNFCNRYQYVMENYMTPTVISLDRHKVAAIGIVEFILSDVLKYTEPPHKENEIFMPKYYLAAQTGLAFMQYWFNNLLETKVRRTIEEWYWPQLLSYPQDKYFCSFSRNLYYTEQRIKLDNKYALAFNELELAEKLYLFEYITILYNKINPKELIDDE